MSFRHLVLGLLSTTLVASTVSVQAASPVAKTDKPAAADVVKSIVGDSKAAPASKPATTSTSTLKTVQPSGAFVPPTPPDTNRLVSGSSLLASRYSTSASTVDPYSWGVTYDVLNALKQATKLQAAAKGSKASVLKNNQAAEKVLLSALSRVEAAQKQNEPNKALLNRALAKHYQNTKNTPEALAYANRLLQIDKDRFGEKNLFVAEDMKLLGDLYSNDQAFDDAAKTYQKALKMANKAPDSQYCGNIKYAPANKNRKQLLVASLYDGLAVANFQPPDEDDDGTAAAAADAYFTKAVGEILKSSDQVDKYNRANLLFSRYKQYLKSSDQPEKAAKANDQIEDYERRIHADREYRIQPSTKL